ncbi:hypothetical protein [Enterococcus sp. AZ109]|uniref:hypothetical protein n=1 Tax=Enterococcus sp. AZ109 TaxID=2774634 RepID=UPI003F240CFF
MYQPAVEAGIPADKYWSLSYEEIIVQATANQKVRERDMKEKAIMDYKLAQLNAFSFNDPKKMPGLDEFYGLESETKANETLDGSEVTQQEISAEDRKWMREQANMMQIAAAIKRTNARKQEGG